MSAVYRRRSHILLKHSADTNAVKAILEYKEDSPIRFGPLNQNWTVKDTKTETGSIF